LANPPRGRRGRRVRGGGARSPVPVRAHVAPGRFRDPAAVPGYRRGMVNGYLIRQASAAAVAADVLRPPKSMATSVFAMFGGWLGAELAPHALAGLAFDNGQRVLRRGIRGRADAAGLALGVAAGAGFAASLAVSRRAGGSVAEAFGKDLSAQDRDVLDRVPDADPA